MPSNLKVENLYKTSITSATSIPASGDFTFDVAVPPINSSGWMIV